MRLAVTLVAAIAVTLGADAHAIGYTPWPSSGRPVWIANDKIRFTTNVVSRDWVGEPWIVGATGEDFRRATDDETSAPSVPPPSGEGLEYRDPVPRASPLYVVYTDGHRHLIDAEAYGHPDSLSPPPGGAALSPDGKTVVFAEWVGWTYVDGSVLYAAPLDGSREPVRLTPDPCTMPSARGVAIGGRCIDGTDGPDRVAGTKVGDVVIAGSGDDFIRGGDGQNEIQAQWGADTVSTGSGHDEVWGGAGNDVIRTGAGGDLVIPGTGLDAIDTGRGRDHIYANDGQRDIVNCGPGVDGVVADRVDVLRQCETVHIRPAFDGWPEPR